MIKKNFLIEQSSLMSGSVPVERCAKLVTILSGFKKVKYIITEKGVLFEFEAPANFSLSLVYNLIDATRLYLDGHDMDDDLRKISNHRDKPVRK